MSNTITTEQGIEVYEDQILYYADEYKNSVLTKPEDIYDSACFDGMIDYIYTRLFKPGKNDKIYYNTRNSKLDSADIDTLDNIFRVLRMLCGKYKKRITLLRFCNLIGIGNDTISQWISGECRGASSSHCQTAKKWKEICESALYSSVVDNNSIGGIFALKACYGYRETAPIAESEPPRPIPRLSRSEIASHFGISSSDELDLPEPEKPEI